MAIEGDDSTGASLEQTVRRLADKDEIRDCLYRYARGIDRIERDLIESAFHDGAVIEFGKLFSGSLQDFLDVSISVQKRQTQCQHIIGNILIELDGDVARVESYEVARHKTPMGDRVVDMVLCTRFLDRFERRNSRWGIVSRRKVLDSGRFLNADESIHDNPPLPEARRDESDLSYELFGKSRNDG